MNAWSKVAGIILRKKYFFLSGILLITVFFAYHIKDLELSYKRQGILPAQHPLMKEYGKFRRVFPENENLILIGIKDSALFRKDRFLAWKKLTDTLDKCPQTEKVVSVTNLPLLELDRKNKRGFFIRTFDPGPVSSEKLELLHEKLKDSLPFYKNTIYNSGDATLMFVYIKPALVNTKQRKAFVFEKLIPLVRQFERETGIKTHTSGLLYIRTLNGKILKRELPLFIGLTLLITSLILWFFFRSFPPIFISLTIVTIAAVWVSGFMGLLGFKITILSAIIPALIIVIGVPNTIFLINKYQQEIIKHRNQAKSLQRVITKTGNAIFMTNLTTAIGFITFTVVNNPMLREFGIAAGFGILSLFVISILLIPIIYSLMHIPRSKHLRHLEKKWLNGFIEWLIETVKRKKVMIFSTALIAIVVSIIGLYEIKVSGSILADLPKNQKFYKDIKFFENEFGGILPLDFMVDARKKKRIFSASVLQKMNEFQKQIDVLEELSPSVSVVNAVKYAKQVFYNGNPEYYGLPSRHERNFIMPYYKNTRNERNDLSAGFVDSTGRYARITVFMKDLEIDDMERVEHFLDLQKKRIFPEKQFDVLMTGQARLFLEGTKYLLNNLTLSLGLTILLISLVIYWMFRSRRILIVSMLANLLPLLVTAGLMGFLGVPLKPSTILIFGITLGISIDDTIHFLTKYRDELKKHQGRVRKAVYMALKETGISMFYTSVVLFFGFLVFVISNYGGTKALGGLVSFTLLVAMFSNLLLLPSLLLFLDQINIRKRTLKKYE
jgi:predicted RND superfamily exporter protein